jgi:hydroxymethylglutaryl-CoA synthase
MIGITAYGGYIPYNRLARVEIQKETGGSGLKGERAVAGYDEDSVTLAVAAALNATQNRYKLDLRGVFFASTTSPYAEKQSDTTIAGALDLPEQIRTAEFANTLRAGTTAVLAAADAVTAGGGPILVAAGDVREGGASGANEAAFGDAGAAVVMGRENVLASLVGSASIAMEIVDTWRNQGDPFVRSWDERFQLEYGYGRAIPDVLKALGASVKFDPASISKVVFPVAPKIQQMLLQSGFKREQIADSLMNDVGLSGTAHPLLMLVNELENARPGDRILVLAYGEGADALLFQVEEANAKFSPVRKVADLIKSKRNELTYATYLKWRQKVDVEPPRRPEPGRPSSPYMRRRTKYNLALYGSRCSACGTAQFPAQRVCYKCRAKDQMVDYGFRDKVGKLTTYSADYLSYSLSPPEIVAVVDFDGGGRMLCNMVDVKPQELQIGQQVEMSFRKMFTAGGIHTYFWKAQGIR